MTAALTVGLGVGPGLVPAYADHEYGGYDGGCDGGGYCAEEDNRGDCRNSEGPCEDNDFSPSFDKSPVEDSFKIGPVCLPGSTCHFDGDGNQGGDAQQPAS